MLYIMLEQTSCPFINEYRLEIFCSIMVPHDTHRSEMATDCWFRAVSIACVFKQLVNPKELVS